MTTNTGKQILNHVESSLIEIAIQKQDPSLLKKLRESDLFNIPKNKFFEYFLEAREIGNKDVTDELLLNKNLVGSLFLKAAAGNILESPQRLIYEGMDINSVNEDGFSALMEACQKGNQIIVNSLLENGADVNIQDSAGSTAIDYASQYGRVDVVSCLLHRVNAESKFGALNSAMNSHNPNAEICGIIWDHLSAQGITQDQSGNNFAHLIVANANLPNFTKNKKFFTKNMAEKLFQKPYFNPLQEDSLGRTAIEFEFDLREVDVAKTMFEMLSAEQQIVVLNKTTLNGRAETVGNFLLGVIEV